LIVFGFVPEEAGDGIGRKGRRGGACEQTGDGGEDGLEAFAGLEEGGDGRVVRGDAALGGGALEGGEVAGAAEEGADAGMVAPGGSEEGRWGNGTALGDGGGEIAFEALFEDDAEEGGGDALGLGALPDEEGAGDDGRTERLRRKGVFEAGIAAVLEGVEVAGLGAGAGAMAAMEGRGWRAGSGDGCGGAAIGGWWWDEIWCDHLIGPHPRPLSRRSGRGVHSSEAPSRSWPVLGEGREWMF
jgi:hypothetical protein